MNIKHTQNIFKSSNGVNNIAYYILRPDEEKVRGIVQISHGMCEYFSRYTDFARFLCANGFIVCGHDHLGHGATANASKDFGYFCRKDGDICLVEDMYNLTKIMRERFGEELPYFLLGHSMGSIITRVYLTKYGNNITGALLTGTFGGSTFYPMLLQLITTNIRAKGSSYRSEFINNLVFTSFNKAFKTYQSTLDWLTRDKDIISLYEKDEKCNFIFTLSGFHDLINLIINANTKKTFCETPKDLPIFFLSGDLDPMGNFGKAVKNVFDAYQKSGNKNVTFKLYRDCRHEVLNELCRYEAYNDILGFIDAFS